MFKAGLHTQEPGGRQCGCNGDTVNDEVCYSGLVCGLLLEQCIEVPDLSIVPGAQVKFSSGSLQGLNGKVLAQLSATNRIQVLLEFLGNEITVAVSADDILLAPDAE